MRPAPTAALAAPLLASGPHCPAAARLYDAAVTLAPTPIARLRACQARAAATRAADEAEYQADPAGYRLRDMLHDEALAGAAYYYPAT